MAILSCEIHLHLRKLSSCQAYRAMLFAIVALVGVTLIVTGVGAHPDSLTVLIIMAILSRHFATLR